MKYQKHSRRQFLKGSGGFLLAIPTLTSLMPREAAAAITTGAKRFIAVAYDNGRIAQQWYPSAAVDAGLAAVSGVPFMREMPMSSISGNISQIFDTPFNGNIRSQLLLLRGLDGLWHIPSDDHVHRTSSVLAGTTLGRQYTEPDGAVKGSPSIDYVLSRNTKSNPAAANPNSYLNLGAHFMGAQISFRYSGGNISPLGRDTDPLTVFNRLFGNVGTTITQTSDRPKKVVDLVIEHYRQVKGSSKISTKDRQLLQDHMDTLSELERSIAGLPSAANCAKPAAPRGGSAGAGNSYDVERVLNLHVELMAAAIKCGIVNVGTIQTGDCTDNIVYANLGLSARFHHDYSHASDAFPSELLKISKFHAGFFMKLANLLNVEESGTGATYLHNSLLMHGNVHGHGNRHEYIDMPVMLAGSLGGRIRSGRYVDYSDRNRTQKSDPRYAPPIPIGRTYNSFLVTILQAMGLSESDYQQPNVQPGFGCDTIDARWGAIESWRNQRRSPLPGIIA